MMKITGLSHLFKWGNLHNWWLTKYFFAPLYIQFKFMFRPIQCTLQGTYTFASNWNHGGISSDVHFAGHLHSNRTNV